MNLNDPLATQTSSTTLPLTFEYNLQREMKMIRIFLGTIVFGSLVMINMLMNFIITSKEDCRSNSFYLWCFYGWRY